MFISIFARSKNNAVICMYLVSTREGKNSSAYSMYTVFSFRKISESNYEKRP